MSQNAIYAQSGGVTSVINAQACGLIEAARSHSKEIGKVYAALNGIIGVLREELIDTSDESANTISALAHTPSGAFGSCRYKLGDPQTNPAEYHRILEVFRTHNIGYFFYNGGGDSQDTTHKIAAYCAREGYPVACIGLPKTIDNDLPITDNSPGFGSVAKYVAVSTLEAGMDVASMSESSTKVFIMEVMGRHAGWIAAAAGLACNRGAGAPHIILFPEVCFNPDKFLERVDNCVKHHGFCVIVASEGIKDKSGNFVSDHGLKDAFGHAQLGGVAPQLAALIKEKLNLKYHWAVSDYLQRAARHIASKTDVDQAYATGKAAVEYALAGENAIMPIIVRKSTSPYQWEIDRVSIAEVANQEKVLPRNYITEDGFGVTTACLEYLQPLIKGEAFPPFVEGLPNYVTVKKSLITKKLPPKDF